MKRGTEPRRITLDELVELVWVQDSLASAHEARQPMKWRIRDTRSGKDSFIMKGEAKNAAACEKAALKEINDPDFPPVNPDFLEIIIDASEAPKPAKKAKRTRGK